MDSSLSPADPGHAMAGVVDTARGWLRLLAVRQIPSRLRAKVAPSDLVQKTVLEAFVGAGRFEGSSREELYAWLRGILRNNALDAIRHYHDCRSRDVTLERRFDELDSRERRDASLVADRRPDRDAMCREEEEVLEGALGTLPELHATIVRQRCLNNMRFEEIGRRHGRSAEAVRKIWARSIVRLREHLAAEGDRNGDELPGG
jgi:RNA polymerase sigma-70 factor (ECF subfamily)